MDLELNTKLLVGRFCLKTNKKISVVIISGSVGKTPEDIAHSFVFNEAYRLACEGIDVHVVRSKIEKDELSYRIHFYGIERKIDARALYLFLNNIFAYPPISLLRKPTLLYWDNLYALKVIRVVKEHNIDLIHAHFAYPEGLVGLLTKRRTKKPLILTLHGYDILAEPSVNFGLRLSKRYDVLIRHVIKRADAIIVNSKAVYLEALKSGLLKKNFI